MVVVFTKSDVARLLLFLALLLFVVESFLKLAPLEAATESPKFGAGTYGAYSLSSIEYSNWAKTGL